MGRWPDSGEGGVPYPGNRRDPRRCTLISQNDAVPPNPTGQRPCGLGGGNEGVQAVEFVRLDTTVLLSPSAHLPVLVDEWCQNETLCRTCSEAWTVRGKPSHPADCKLANPTL